MISRKLTKNKKKETATQWAEASPVNELKDNQQNMRKQGLINMNINTELTPCVLFTKSVRNSVHPVENKTAALAKITAAIDFSPTLPTGDHFITVIKKKVSHQRSKLTEASFAVYQAKRRTHRNTRRSRTTNAKE